MLIGDVLAARDSQALVMYVHQSPSGLVLAVMCQSRTPPASQGN
jgi:hypothetical protein